jgi:hypothetical protein
MFAILLIAAAILPVTDTVLRDACDLIEVNHFFDDQGRLVFDQAIFYDWSAGDSRYNVRAWRLVKHSSQLPQREWPSGYSALWQDGEVTRRVWLQAIRETFTQYDPELLEREVLPKEKRRELRVK